MTWLRAFGRFFEQKIGLHRLGIVLSIVIIAIAAVVYCLWTVVGGDPPTVVNAMVALLASVPLYPFFIRSMEAAAARKRTAIPDLDPAPERK